VAGPVARAALAALGRAPGPAAPSAAGPAPGAPRGAAAEGLAPRGAAADGGVEAEQNEEEGEEADDGLSAFVRLLVAARLESDTGWLDRVRHYHAPACTTRVH
jgi:hypothetical protein